MRAIAILNKKERRENRADNTSKRQYNEGNQAKACRCIMYEAERPGRSDIQFLMRGSSYPFIPIATS